MGLGSQSIITQVNHLLAGRLVIPSIQRGYVWQKSQVPFLLDSLYRGYPVGSLLVWNTNLDVPLKKAAVLQDEEVQLRPAVLLDGQQRLTSLAKVVAPERVAGGRLDVRFDLDSETFLNASAADRHRPRLVSVTELLGDSPQFGPILDRAGVARTDPAYDTVYDRIRRVHEIRRYEVAVTTVESDDYETVAEIFARVNQGGRRLSKGDLVYSAIAARWPEGLDVIDAFNDRLHALNFALDREAVLRLTGLLAGSGSHVIRLIAKSVTGEDLKRAWLDTERAIGFAVDFLQGECGVPRSAVLSSPNLVVIPGYLLFRSGNRLSPEEAEGLRRWVYTAMAFSYYSNQVEGKLDSDARLVRERAGAELFDELIRRASGPRPAGAAIEPGDLASKKSSSSWFNLLYVAALRVPARDWVSNRMLTDVPMTSDSKIEYHHVFPKARVNKAYGNELTNGIANLAFISGDSNRKIAARLPAQYLPEIPVERLQEQWVPIDPACWDIDRFQTFLVRRRGLLANVLNDLLGLRPYRIDAPPVADAELPHDDEDVDIESSARTPTFRRDVAQHILECFEGLPGDVELSIAQIVAAPSTQYDAGEISPGAVRARLEAGSVSGFEVVPGRSPMSARRRPSGEANSSGMTGAASDSTATPDDKLVSSEGLEPNGRRDVARHILEVVAKLPADAELTVRELAAHASSQYEANEISQGAISARFNSRAGIPGVEVVPGSSPVRARKHAERRPDVDMRADAPGSSTADLARAFHSDMVQLYQRSKQEVGYNPTAFIRMVSDLGGVETAKRLVTQSGPSDGFATLWDAKRLDLAAEALVVTPKYEPLFGPDIVDRARQRLLDHGFPA
ncbi:MAG: hypothetical protein JWM93_1177 [Frankiales bacterium]|nr:hypothetical protein [Frankiales bacterium]